ncbi:hypothetical protein FRC18_008471 [Serendipita sp. 400]|nr:hypothetical protein FRC18_008471 [Serendipita sp. 400]
MPIIEIVDDDEDEQNQPSLSLEDTLKSLKPTLKVPKEFQNEDWAVQEKATSLIAWRKATSVSIKGLWDIVSVSDKLELDVHFVSIVAIMLPFTGNRAWTKPETRQLAEEILQTLGIPTQSQLRQVLLNVVKPAFEATSHNIQINPETATKVTRTAQLEPFYRDYDEDAWKEDPGLVDIVLWCLSSMKQSDWEVLWPLVIPPILAYMSDWEAIHRLSGIALARKLLEGAPKDLIRRSGIDQLMRSSLDTSLQRYSDSLSPALFKNATMAMLDLIFKTTQPGSSERFDRLFALLGDNMIGGAWSFGYRMPLLIQTTYEVLPLILEPLGLASVRFLKGMIPQLLHTLVPGEGMKPSVTMQTASLRALQHVINYGAPRMAYWSGEIVSGIAKCWVLLEDKGRDSTLSKLLGAVLKDIEKACPEIFLEHMGVIQEHDQELFAQLKSLFS